MSNSTPDHAYIADRIKGVLNEYLPNDNLEMANVEQHAIAFQGVIAELIAYAIDAGSERDAVNEDDEVHDFLVSYLTKWAIDQP